MQSLKCAHSCSFMPAARDDPDADLPTCSSSPSRRSAHSQPRSARSPDPPETGIRHKPGGSGHVDHLLRALRREALELFGAKRPLTRRCLALVWRFRNSSSRDCGHSGMSAFGNVPMVFTSHCSVSRDAVAWQARTLAHHLLGRSCNLGRFATQFRSAAQIRAATFNLVRRNR